MLMNDYIFLAAIALSSILVILSAGYIDHRMYTKFIMKNSVKKSAKE